MLTRGSGDSVYHDSEQAWQQEQFMAMVTRVYGSIQKKRNWAGNPAELGCLGSDPTVHVHQLGLKSKKFLLSIATSWGPGGKAHAPR